MTASHEEKPGRFSFFLHFATFIAAVAVLRIGQEVLVPVAIAALIGFLLWPLVERLRGIGLGKTLSVVVAATAAFAVITGVGWVMGNQALEVLRELPRYETNIDAKIAKLRGPDQGNAISRVVDMVQRYEKELAAPPDDGLSGGEKAEERQAVAVRVEPSHRSTLAAVGAFAAPALGPLGTAGIVLIFVIAILMQREDLQGRLLELVGHGRIRLVRRAIADASSRVYRYLSMQLLVNTCYGILVGLGLFFVGIPNPILWGMLAMLLRFIPYLGPWLAAAFPVLLSVAIEPGWVKVACTLGLYMVAEIVTANLVELLIYGAAAGISGLALLFAAVFWTWLWGVPGLFLSTPLTVCLMAMGRYFPALRVFNVLFERSESQDGLTSGSGQAKSKGDEPPAPAHSTHHS